MIGGTKHRPQAGLSREELEARRLQAIPLFERGTKPSQVARELGVSRTTASRWRRALETSGTKGLAMRRAPGRPPRLNLAEFGETLRAMFAEASPQQQTQLGFANLIAKRLGVTYDPDYVGRLMRTLGIGTRHGYPSSRRAPQRPVASELVMERFTISEFVERESHA